MTSRPIGGCREAWRAWPGFEPTRRAKLVARTASGRAGLAAAGDLAGLRRWPGIWRGYGGGRESGGATAVAGNLAGCGRHRKTNGGVGVQIRKTGDPKAAGYLCVMGDLNPQPAD